VAEIPKTESARCRDSMEIRALYSRPDPNEDDEHDVLCSLPTEIIEQFRHSEEKVWDVHGGVYGISDEREVDAVTPPGNGCVSRQIRAYAKPGANPMSHRVTM
jgi:hypothetical protein